MGAAVPKVQLKPQASQDASGPSILQLTVSLFAADESCERIVVCAPPVHRSEFQDALAPYRDVLVVDGGSTRQESVMLGVSALEAEGVSLGDVAVLVHDAARCCLSQEVIARVLAGVAKHGAVTAAVPVVDSLCRVSDGRIESYVDRASAWSIQTPQGFLGNELLEAHRSAVAEGLEALDDAALVARIRPVSVVLGDRLNIKITQPEDLSVAAAALSRR